MNTWTDEKIIELLQLRLNAQRFEHSLNVAESAAGLSKILDCDSKKAYTAGLLHDIMKNSAEEEQLSVLTQNGIVLSKVETANKKLWHAVSGAAYVKGVMGISDSDIVNAVRYHTTGRAGMSSLEKAVYLADFISAERTYNGVEKMRRLCTISCDEAVLFALSFSIPDLILHGSVVHPDSVDLYNETLCRVNNIIT